MSLLRVFLFLLAWGGLSLPLSAQDLIPQVPSAVLLDQVSGRILYQKNPELSIPPASLTKLMTLHLTWEALGHGQIRASDLVPVTEATTGTSVPPGSSLMFLEPGQRVTVRELMLGLAVDSGNDAAMTLAQFLSGSQEAFVAQMNKEAQALGMTHTVFFDTYGYDARNHTTAMDFAEFCRIYILLHPESIHALHDVRKLAFPLAENLPRGDHRRPRTIVQENRNALLGAYPGADGLKTGYIDESGYNLAATALRHGQRLVAVLLGVQAKNEHQGTRERTAAAARLLDFGFQNYPLRPLTLPTIHPVRVWFSAKRILRPVPASTGVYPLSEEEGKRVMSRVEGPKEIRGPLLANSTLGQVVWALDGHRLGSVPLITTEADPASSWWQQLWDHLVLLIRSLWGRPGPQNIAPRTVS